jgi:excisionase family DNA binding protein
MYLTTQQVAERLGISSGKVKQLIETGTLPSLPTRGSKKFYRIDEQAVIAYKRAQRQAATAVPAGSGALTPITATQANYSALGSNGVPPGFMGVSEAASLLGLHKSGVYRKAHDGEIASVKIGGRYYFKPSERPETAAREPEPRVEVHARLNEHSQLDRLEAKVNRLSEQLQLLLSALITKR